MKTKKNVLFPNEGENLRLWNEWREVPAEAKKSFNSSGFSGTDINPTYRIMQLTAKFGLCGIGWYYTIDRQWLETYENVVKAFCNVSLYIKLDTGEWSMPIMGTGGNFFTMPTGKGVRVSDECYKMALTDAISVCCHRLGLGADIYWEEGKSKYTQSVEKYVVAEDQKINPELEDLLNQALDELKDADKAKATEIWSKYSCLHPKTQGETCDAKIKFYRAMAEKGQEFQKKEQKGGVA